ncbi:MAG: hypothetical protein IJR85_04145 [Synergistaceae bacterium]|nr:hypothetical protein [Synergistaceae bacterium]
MIKDIAEKRFFANNDVFAEVFNELVLKGTGLVIHEDELEDARTRSLYMPSVGGEVREQERDIAKFWKKNGVILSLLGVESQTMIDRYMPVRVFGYEGADYRYQLVQREEARKAGCSSWKFYPVITAVLYYGTDRRWSKYKSLHECLDIPSELRGIVEDRHINVIELAWLSEEQNNRMKTDLGLVVDMLRQIASTGEYIPRSEQDVRHVKDIMLMFRALTGRMDWYTDAMLSYALRKEKGEKATMIDLVGAIHRGGVSVGRAEGIAVGRTEGITVGRAEGIAIGRTEGIAVGKAEGIAVGKAEGIVVGRAEGQAEMLKNSVKFMREIGTSQADIDRFIAANSQPSRNEKED